MLILVLAVLISVFTACDSSTQNNIPKLVIPNNPYGTDEFVNDTEFLQKYRIRGLERPNCIYINIKIKLPQETVLYTHKNREKIPAGIIPEQTPVTILADGRGSLCLIKIDGADGIWTGWIEKSALQINTRKIFGEELRFNEGRSRYKDYNVPVVGSSMSPDDTLLVLISEEKEPTGITIIDNKGDTIFNLKTDQVFDYKPIPFRRDRNVGHINKNFISFIYGWSDDSKNVWLAFLYGMYGLRILYILPYENNFIIFTAPVNLSSHFYDVDVNSGDLYYTDFQPHLLKGRRRGSMSRRAEEDEIINNNFKNTFHLYRYNLFTKESVLLREVYGKGLYMLQKNGKMVFYEVRRENNENIYEEIGEIE